MTRSSSISDPRSEPAEAAVQNEACGLLFCYNEEHILAECIEYYLAQGIDLVVIDNDSTDSSPSIANAMKAASGASGTNAQVRRSRGRLRDIVKVTTQGYEWQSILRTACDYMHEHLSSYEWILLIDADAFYQSPVRGMGLVDFLIATGGAGHNIVDANVFDFYPTESDDPAVSSHVRRLRYCDPRSSVSLDFQHKAFRYHESVDFYTASGHRCLRQGPRISPLPMIYRHYGWCSFEHGLRKVFTDRKPRYVERSRDMSLHWHHLHLLPTRKDLIRDSSDLWLFDEQVVQIDGRRFQWLQKFAVLSRVYARVRKPLLRTWRRIRARIGMVRNSKQPWSFVTRIGVENTVHSCLGFLHALHPKLLTALAFLAPQRLQQRLALDKACAFYAGPGVGSGRSGTKAGPFVMVRARDLIRQNPVPFGLPKTIHFLLTNQCNARCLFCNQDFLPGRAQLDLEAFRTMVSHIPPYLGCEFLFSGGGEPTLCRDLGAIIRFTNQKRPWIRTSLCTNGLLLGRQARELAEAHLERVDISVHSATSEGNSRLLQVRGPEDLFEGVRMLEQELRARQCRTRIRFRPAVSRLNIGEVPGLVKAAASLGVDEVEVNVTRYYPWHAYRGKHGQRADPGDSLFYDQRLYNDVMLESRRLARTLGVAFFHEPLFGARFDVRPCAAPWTTLIVDNDGRVYPCTGGEIWFGNKVRSGQYDFGNLLQQNLVDIWTCDDLVGVRRTCSPGKDSFVPECDRCHNLACMQGPDERAGHIIEEPYTGWRA